ncbi:hypothetical protein PDESU_02105 [Pontiella desulfatans]|uniref:Uncharacterized protein n=1 Tax=Pontiella desulfatans TaxID=2750659 RepID=A0A6C2U0R0_PONDE|nr:hypothetical protein [Pontiella desulfatans]VGO13548.1 hypothetical protein PDESU_02105 [Pontiella desulfatans]
MVKMKQWISQLGLLLFVLPLKAAEPAPMQMSICPAITTGQKADAETVFRCFEDLFEHRLDEWSYVAENLSQFKFYSTPMGRLCRGEPELLRTIMQRLSELNLGVGIEVGIRHGHENLISRLLDPITEAGGRVDFLVTDNVFIKSQGWAKEEYNWSYEEAVERYATFVAGVKEKYPNIKIGMIEAAFRFYWEDPEQFPPEGNPKKSQGDLKELLLDVMKACEEKGTKLDMFQPEYSYQRIENTRNGWGKLKAMEQFCRSNGMDFIFLFNDHEGGNVSNQAFYEGVIHCLQQVQKHDLRPTMGTIQSWYKHPTVELPEDEPYTFMNLARDFIHTHKGKPLPPKFRVVATSLGGAQMVLADRKNRPLKVKVFSVYEEAAVLLDLKSGAQRKIAFELLAPESVEQLRAAKNEVGKAGYVVELVDKQGRSMNCVVLSVAEQQVKVRPADREAVRDIPLSALSPQSIDLLDFLEK